jgi:hypothetical protein
MGVQQQCKLALSLLAFLKTLRKVVEETVRRNDSLPATSNKITTMAGCSALKITRNRSTISLKKNQMTTEELTIEVNKALEEIRPFEF